MKQVSEMPTSGRFVAVWQTNEIVVSDNFIYLPSGLYSSGLHETLTSEKISYFVREQENRQCKYFIAD